MEMRLLIGACVGAAFTTFAGAQTTVIELRPIANNTNAFAYRVSNQGQVAVGWSSLIQSETERPTSWSPGAAPLDLGIPVGAYALSYGDVSADGGVIVGDYYDIAAGRVRPFRWSAGEG